MRICLMEQYTDALDDEHITHGVLYDPVKFIALFATFEAAASEPLEALRNDKQHPNRYDLWMFVMRYPNHLPRLMREW